MEAEIDRLPDDVLADVLAVIDSFSDLAQASGVCRKWRMAVELSLGRRRCLSFAGWNVDDNSAARIVSFAYSLKELDISRSCWGCRITDEGLCKISTANCVRNLTSISLWGMVGITDKGVVQLVSRAIALQHLNVGGTFITDESLFAIANNCLQLKAIVLWSCRHVTEHGLYTLVNSCHKLESINVWGMRVPLTSLISLRTISPTLNIRPVLPIQMQKFTGAYRNLILVRRCRSLLELCPTVNVKHIRRETNQVAHLLVQRNRQMGSDYQEVYNQLNVATHVIDIILLETLV